MSTSKKNKIEQISGSYNVRYYKEIKRSKSLQKAEAYLESKRTSTMELFVDIFNIKTYYFRNISSIIDVRLGYI